MAKVLFVKSENITPDNQGIVPPMGIMYLASTLQTRGQHEIKVVDTRFSRFKFEHLRRTVQEFNPDVVGISTITIEAPSMHRIAEEVKSVQPGALVVAGGPHPTAYPRETLKDQNIDFVVPNEGEETFLEFCETHDRCGDLTSVPGLIFKQNDDIGYSAPRLNVPDVDSISFPAWDLIEIEAYAKHKSMSTMGKRRYMTLVTSRGCPFRCIYCHEMHGKKFRERSPENVLEEIQTIVSRYGIRDFEILDDIFNFDLKRAKTILRSIVEENLNIELQFPNAIRADRVDDEFMQLLREAGTRYLCVAVETTSPRIQKMIQKHLKVDVVKDTIAKASRLGIYTRGFFMLGFPTETREEMRETVEFAISSKLHEALFFIVTPFEGTELAELYHQMMPDHKIDFKDMDYFRGNYNLSQVPDEELFALQREAYKRFYTNPGRIFRIFSAHPRKKDLPDLAWMAFRKFLIKARGNKPKYENTLERVQNLNAREMAFKTM